MKICGLSMLLSTLVLRDAYTELFEILVYFVQLKKLSLPVAFGGQSDSASTLDELTFTAAQRCSLDE